MSDVTTVPIKFDGSNHEDLDRLVALCTFKFILDTDFDDNDVRKCAYLATNFEGPALDWVMSRHLAEAVIFENFVNFVTEVRQAFGVEADNLMSLRRTKLDELKWGPEVPVFFAEFDRLTLQLGIADHATRILLVRQKLPTSWLKLLAEQALNFANYDTMRERLITMWTLDPHSRTSGGSASSSSKPRCGRCGKKGHTAKDCRSNAPKN